MFFVFFFALSETLKLYLQYVLKLFPMFSCFLHWHWCLYVWLLTSWVPFQLLWLKRVLQDISIERTFVAFLLCSYMRSSFCCFCLGKKCWLSLRFWFTMFFVPLKVMQIHLHFLLEFVHWWRLKQAWIFSFVSKLFLFLPHTEFFFIHKIKIICHFVSENG